MENPEQVKAEMRLWALEILAVNSFAMLCLLDPKPNEFLKLVHDQMIAGARKLTFPGADAVTSDYYSSEFEMALDRLMGMVGIQMRVRQAGVGKS